MNFRNPNNPTVKILNDESSIDHLIDPPTKPMPENHSLPDSQTQIDRESAFSTQDWDPDSNEDNYWDDGAATT